jgi:hypothetical protein
MLRECLFRRPRPLLHVHSKASVMSTLPHVHFPHPFQLRTHFASRLSSKPKTLDALSMYRSPALLISPCFVEDPMLSIDLASCPSLPSTMIDGHYPPFSASSFPPHLSPTLVTSTEGCRRSRNRPDCHLDPSSVGHIGVPNRLKQEPRSASSFCSLLFPPSPTER